MTRLVLKIIRASIGLGLMAGLLSACGVPGATMLTKGDLAFNTAKIFTKKRVAVETGGMPDFRAKEPTEGMMVGGMAGQIAAAGIGNEIVENNAVPNPAQQVGDAIIASLAGRGMSPAPNRLAADLLVEITTYKWTIATFAQDPNRYYIVFSSIARMKDAQTEEVLGQTSCKNVVTDTQASAAPTYQEMMANGAARLKIEMLEITKKCADQIVSRSLV